VIPELQVPDEVQSHANPRIQRVLVESADARGPADRVWKEEIEEPVWRELIERGRDREKGRSEARRPALPLP